jgi:hypothetical protein
MNVYVQRLLLILIALMVSGPSLAGMYKWTDSSGQVHYTDSPPADQKAKALNPATATPTGAEVEKSKQDKQLEEFNKRQAEEKEKEELARKKALEKKQREQQCATLRKNLQLYLTKRRVAKNENGVVVEVPYEERLKEIENIQDQMKKVCDDN